ncbi:MAG: HAMP domain-containing histidine kinase [Alphaproteobacteria bacterium]|nr:HAMP domain-containing histidine kinase [Alphaproteobacteria bacterium]
MDQINKDHKGSPPDASDAGPKAGSDPPARVVPSFFSRLPFQFQSRTSQTATVNSWQRLRLPFKLLVLTTAFVMLAEVLIFVPSVANHRHNWLNDRLMAAHLAALAAEAAPGRTLAPMLRHELLRTAAVKAVAVRHDGRRTIVLPPTEAMTIDAHFDLSPVKGRSYFTAIRDNLELVAESLAALVRSDNRTLRVTGPIPDKENSLIEIVIPEAPLREALLLYGRNILFLSIIISLFTAALVYIALSSLLVRPMTRITDNMLRFAQDPEDASRIIEPSTRGDEVGIAERELASMQRQLSQLLLQKNRLAQLGLAVSKINHDLRNMLANAQLISDRLTTLPDPTVQRFAPKLIASLDRAIDFCNDTLKFGRAQEAAPRRQLMLLRPLAEEVGDGLGLPREGSIDWRLDIDPALRVDADHDHLYRVLSNLCRNAVQALEAAAAPPLNAKPGSNTAPPPPQTPLSEVAISAQRDGRRVTIEVRDNGPGIPPRAREHLFKAFQSSQRRGGSGLGLAIAQELVTAHGGSIQLLENGPGAAFRLIIPDRNPHA